jgi:hypothetical protein
MQTMLRDLRILWRAERIIAESQLRLAARRTALAATAGLIAFVGLAMLNVTGFLALGPIWGAAWAAFALAIADLVIAAIVLVVALSSRLGPDYAAAVELRDLSMKDLETEFASSSKSPLGLLSGSGGRDPLEALLPVVLMPLLTAAVRAVKHKVVD